MKKQVIFLLVLTLICESWSIPKPIESVENYNILMVHGAYGESKGFGNAPYVFFSRICDSLLNPVDSLPTWDVMKVIFNNDSILELVNNYVFPEANEDTSFLGEANIGYYGSHGRLTYWLNKRIFEDDSSSKPQTSYTYHWRSFSNPANSSSNNAHELGDRKWNQGNLSFGNGGFGHRRTLMEEAQEVKASCCHAALVAASPFLKCSQKFIQCYLALCNTLFIFMLDIFCVSCLF